jgi:hypothetical protein
MYFFLRAHGGGVFGAAAAFRRGWPAKIRPGPGWPKIAYQNRGVFGFWHLICHCGAALAALRGCKFAYETAGAGTRFYGQRAQSHAEGHVELKDARMTRERSIAGGRSINTSP